MTNHRKITEEDLKNDPVIQCPKCKVNMDKQTNWHYIIDLCPKCGGVFLDKDEVDAAHKVGFVTYIMDYFRKDKKPPK